MRGVGSFPRGAGLGLSLFISVGRMNLFTGWVLSRPSSRVDVRREPLVALDELGPLPRQHAELFQKRSGIRNPQRLLREREAAFRAPEPLGGARGDGRLERQVRALLQTDRQYRERVDERFRRAFPRRGFDSVGGR